MVNGYREVTVERSGKLQKTAVQFRNEEQLLNLAQAHRQQGWAKKSMSPIH